MTIIRQFIPVLDFENLKPKMSLNGEWSVRVVLITSNIVSLGYITMIGFGNIRGNFLVVLSLGVGYGVTFIVGNDDVSAKDKLGFGFFYGVQVFIGLCISFVIFLRMKNNLIEIINMKLAAQGIFKHIFDNSEESIIIVKD